jgi:hypothetical protein
MATKVTDPALLAILNGDSSPAGYGELRSTAPVGTNLPPEEANKAVLQLFDPANPVNNAPQPAKVTDPALLAILNGEQPTVPTEPTAPVRQAPIEQLGNSQFSKNVNADTKAAVESGLQKIMQAGSTEPAFPETFGSDTALGRFAQQAARPFRPALGAVEIASAPLLSTTKNLIAKPVAEATGSEGLGGAAEILSMILAPSGAKSLGSSLGKVGKSLDDTALGRLAKDVGSADFGAGVRNVGAAIEQSGIKSADKARTQFVEDLILPKATPSVKEDLVGRTAEKGWNRKKVVELSPQEQEIAQTVAGIKGVKKSNSLQGNANAIQEANRAEADNLIAALRKNDVAIADDEIVNGLASVRDSLAKNPYVSGTDASKAADSVVNQALEIVMAQPRTASGLLQARKDLDAWVKSQKPNVFDAVDSPVSVAVREVRQGINNIVDKAVPDVAVKESLRKQSNLYRAHDSIATKAKDEAGSRIGRAAQAISKGISVKQGVLGAGALAGLGVTGLAPVVGGAAVPALALYGAKKAISSPELRKAVGGSLRKIGESL